PMQTVARALETTPRSAAAPPPSSIGFAEWILDLSSRQLQSLTGASVRLTQAEHRILVLLAGSPRQAITRDRLMAVTAGREWEPFDRSVDVHISNLRRKLDLDPTVSSVIRTVRGVGYMLVPSRGA
ncbi:MAG: winged helix-turn-helix transcriptional regulator, partial [Proteobacteria bacterium]|nr:winged helix-turn-helix transcriptional regulator [Pseudomonadota bacterium]